MLFSSDSPSGEGPSGPDIKTESTSWQDRRKNKLWGQIPTLTSPRAATLWIRSATMWFSFTRDQAVCPDQEFFAELSRLSEAERQQVISSLSVVKQRQSAFCDIIGVASLPLFIGLYVIVSGDTSDWFHLYFLVFLMVYATIYISTRQTLAQATVIADAVDRHEASVMRTHQLEALERRHFTETPNAE